MRSPSSAIVLLLTLCSTGCITLSERSIDHNFDGLQAAMSRSGTVCMLLVHGMGGYSTGDPQTLIGAIQTQLHLRPIATTDQPIGPTDVDKNVGSLTRQDLKSADGRVLRIYTLKWEPLTEGLKRQYLAYDATPASARLRLPIFNDVKQSLMNENVPDVVLYVGGYRPVLQKAVRAALGRIQHDLGDNKDYEYFFVTFSLGSKIVFDVVDQMDNEANAAHHDEIVDRTASFFMLANQLPLLGLGNVDPATAPETSGHVAGYESMLRFVRRKHQRQQSATAPSPGTQPAGGELSIVAVSDPNDLFSYSIPPYVKQQFPATFVNVVLSVAKTGYWIPTEGYVINPMAAHTGYGHDPDVIKLIIDGWPHRLHESLLGR
jgi:hypothetical protein